MSELSTRYFQFVIYPEERPFYKLDLVSLGILHESPLHHANENGPYKKIPKYVGKSAYNDGQNGFVLTYEQEPKDHIHATVRTPKTKTENAFIAELCEVLKGDMTGIAICKGLCAIEEKNLDYVLRYYLHLDIPTKEHFNIENALSNVNMSFASHCAKAYEPEIRYIVSTAISDGLCETFEDVTYLWGRENWIITAWLNRGKNMQFVYNMLLSQKVKEYKTNVECKRNHNDR